MDFVYGKRNQFLIFIRKYKYKYTSYLLKLYYKLFKSQIKRTKTVLLLPKISSVEILNDYVNKISWAIKPDQQYKVFIYVSKKLNIAAINNFGEHKYQRNYIEKSKVIFISDRKEYLRARKESQLILVWKYRYIFTLIFTSHLSKVKIVDKYLYSAHESTSWYRLKHELQTNEDFEEIKKLSKKNYQALLAHNKHKNKSYIFVTGPTFDNYEEFHFEQDSFKIICNTIVKNHQFLDHINGPDLITFADPAFHFSSCEYAAKLRDEVINTVEKYNSFVMVPLFTVPLMLQHYPQLKDKIIGIEVNNNFGINFPFPDKFWVKNSESIISYMMIPVASVVTEEINILGADGRDKKENYFWKHNKSVQFHDLMETVFHTHPAFFRDRYYADHYEGHIKYLADMFNYGEKLGKKYYSLTPSFVPALQDRFKQINSTKI